jgi:diacylglycerol kinase (ATP)
MSTVIIINPNSGNAEDLSRLREAIDEAVNLEVLTSQAPGDAQRLAAELDDSVELVIVAGGDGTLHEVINGLFQDSDRPAPAVALVPLGTGNDFARTVCIPEDPLIALAVAQNGARRAMDVIRIEDETHPTRYAINVCSGGLAPQVSDEMTDEMKQLWGPLSYVLGTAKSLADVQAFRVRLAFADGDEEVMEAVSVVVANGRTAGGGQPAAPRADPEDGLLDVVVLPHREEGYLRALVAAAMAGDYLDHEDVFFRRASRVRVESDPAMWFNTDGERATVTPATFTVMPSAVDIIVGASYPARFRKG